MKIDWKSVIAIVGLVWILATVSSCQTDELVEDIMEEDLCYNDAGAPTACDFDASNFIDLLNNKTSKQITNPISKVTLEVVNYDYIPNHPCDFYSQPHQQVLSAEVATDVVGVWPNDEYFQSVYTIDPLGSDNSWRMSIYGNNNQAELAHVFVKQNTDDKSSYYFYFSDVTFLKVTSPYILDGVAYTSLIIQGEATAMTGPLCEVVNFKIIVLMNG